MLLMSQAGVVVVGGFHSPTERKDFGVLLRGTQPIVFCPARSLEKMRIKGEFRQPLAEGRLLILSPFEAKQRRMTAELADYRNRFAAALAQGVLVAYAELGGKLAQLAREVIQ